MQTIALAVGVLFVVVSGQDLSVGAGVIGFHLAVAIAR
jgi:ABC-type xylose transport system permease subunit